MRNPLSKIRSTLVLIAALMVFSACAIGESAESAVRTRTITAGIVGGTCDTDGVWYAVRSDEGKLQIRWSAAASDTSYTILITTPGKQQIYDIVTGAVYLYHEKDLPAGTYELRITAYAGGTCSGYGWMKFVLEDAEEEQPEGEPSQEEQPSGPSDDQLEDSETEEDGEGKAPSGGRGGSKPSGRGGKSGGKSQSSPTTVIPGKALTSTHTRGSSSVIPYGTVELTIDDEPMEILILGGEELKLTCNGSAFTGEISQDMLILTSSDGEGTWSVTQRTLITLNESGIREIRLVAGEDETVLDTDLEFSGTAYARERANGYVPSDFLLWRQEGGWLVAVEDRVYDLEQLTVDGQNGDNV